MWGLSSTRASLTIVVACALCACSGADVGAQLSTFDGTYTGTYTGSDSGNVEMRISDGNVTVSATSSFWKTTYSGGGTVTSSGQLVGAGVGGSGTATSGPIVITYGGISISFAGSVADGSATGSWSSSNSGGGAWQAHQ
jgi:hypothetical protein